MDQSSVNKTTTALVYDERFVRHDTGPGHPERPERLHAIIKRLESDGLIERMAKVPITPASLQWVELVHTPAYLNRLEAACRMGQVFIDTIDCTICPDSYEIALLAAGGVLNATDMVMAGEVRNAFAAVRPPGHHAERDLSMGFCLFNNIAIAAQYLKHHHHLDRIAIVDFDVHHGNGTQHTMEGSNDILFISIHEDPASQFPGTGFARETGLGPGEGYTVNLPMNPGQGDSTVMQLFNEKVIPKLDEFEPQFLLVSAGFDGSINDPLGHLEITQDCFAWIARQLVDAADRHCDGKLISILEGGYNLEDLAQAVSTHVKILMGDKI